MRKLTRMLWAILLLAILAALVTYGGGCRKDYRIGGNRPWHYGGEFCAEPNAPQDYVCLPAEDLAEILAGLED